MKVDRIILVAVNFYKKSYTVPQSCPWGSFTGESRMISLLLTWEDETMEKSRSEGIKKLIEGKLVISVLRWHCSYKFKSSEIVVKIVFFRQLCNPGRRLQWTSKERSNDIGMDYKNWPLDLQIKREYKKCNIGTRIYQTNIHR